MAINYIDDKIFEQLNTDIFEHVLRGKYCNSEWHDCMSECLTDSCGSHCPDYYDCGSDCPLCSCDSYCKTFCYRQCNDCRCYAGQCDDCTCNNSQCNDCDCNGTYSCSGDNHICDGENDCWCDDECTECYNHAECPGHGCSNYCSSDSQCECDCY